VHRASSVPNLPAEKTLSIRRPTVDDQALLSVVHAKGTHAATAINRLKPKLANSKTGSVIEQVHTVRVAPL
jgi:hypothetical protein